MAWGWLGTDPHSLGWYLKKQGCKYEKKDLLKNMKKLINEKKDGIYIFSYWNKKRLVSSLHTVVAQYRNGQFEVYNLINTTGITIRTTLDDLLSGRPFITGYYIIKK